MTPPALAAVLFFAVAGPTVAPPTEPSATAAPAATPAAPSAPTPSKEKGPGKSALEVSGRVVVRETLGPAGEREEARAPWAGRLSLHSARVGAKYRLDDVRVEVEAELEGKPHLRDAYVLLDTGWGTALRAGQFKAPFAAIALESSWTLPIVERGRLDELLVDGLQLGGRRPGAQAEWAGRTGVRPRVQIGMWQGSGYDGDPREDETSEAIGETAGARFSVRPGPLELGLSGAWRVAQPTPVAEFERFWAAGADLRVETASRVRAWVETGTGSSWADEDPADGKEAIFGYGRMVAAWRIGGVSRGAPYVEAFGSSGILDPDFVVKDDFVIENAVGLNGGRWKRWRGQVQLGTSRASRNAPASLMNGEPDVRRAVLVQIGVSI